MNNYKNEFIDQEENGYENFDDFEVYEDYEETDYHQYKDSTYELISKVAYLIGVPKRIFENVNQPPKLNVYEELDTDKNARIIRHIQANVEG